MTTALKVTWVLPLLPPSLNAWQSMHWAERQRIKNDWISYVHGLAVRDHLPKPASWVACSAELRFRKGAHRDLSNYQAVLWKVLPDALVRCGVLTDDTAEQFVMGHVTLMVVKQPEGYGRDPRVKGVTKLEMIVTP